MNDIILGALVDAAYKLSLRIDEQKEQIRMAHVQLHEINKILDALEYKFDRKNNTKGP